MFFEKLYNLIYHIGFTAGSGFIKFGKWLSRGLSRPVKTVGAVFFAVFLVIDKFILKTFKTVSAEFKLLMADIKRVSSGLNSLIVFIDHIGIIVGIFMFYLLFCVIDYS